MTAQAAEQRARGLVHGKFTARKQAHLGHGIEAALGVGVEAADAVHLVVKQVDAVGDHRAHGDEVDEAAAHGVLAGADHLRHVVVARQRELGAELGFVEFLAGFEIKGGGGEK